MIYSIIDKTLRKYLSNFFYKIRWKWIAITA